MFTALDYSIMSNIVFQSDYPGFRPEVIESPNGDGKLDNKLFAHIAEKYSHPNHKEKFILDNYLNTAHNKSLAIAVNLGIPKMYWPKRCYGTIRVLEYGPESFSEEHGDFDLFTLSCYRNYPQFFISLEDNHTNPQRQNLINAQKQNEGCHFGELLEEIDAKNYKTTRHKIVASNGPTQYSIVYFASPSHHATLPSGMLVGQWVKERESRSRY